MFEFNKKFEIQLFVLKSIHIFEKSYKSNMFKD